MTQLTADSRGASPQAKFKIHDLVIARLEPVRREAGLYWPALRFDDHILRRFGAAEFVRLRSSEPAPSHHHANADEVWSLIDGKVEFQWEDRREDSPTHGARDRLTCDSPTSVLVPFGVAFTARTLAEASWLLRLSSHEEGEQQTKRWIREQPEAG